MVVRASALVGALVSLLQLSFAGSFLLSRLHQCADAVSRQEGRRPALLRLSAVLLVDLLLGLLAAAALSDLLSPPGRIAEALLRMMDLVVSRLRLLITWSMSFSSSFHF